MIATISIVLLYALCYCFCTARKQPQHTKILCLVLCQTQQSPAGITPCSLCCGALGQRLTQSSPFQKPISNMHV